MANLFFILTSMRLHNRGIFAYFGPYWVCVLVNFVIFSNLHESAENKKHPKLKTEFHFILLKIRYFLKQCDNSDLFFNLNNFEI